MKKAFTLLELLVAIVIIGLILALLFPAFGRVREGTRRVQCMNNLRQHGIAWYLYLDDHDECFPKFGASSQGGASWASFGGKETARYFDKTEDRVLNSYLDIYSDDDKAALEIFHCPDDIKGWTRRPPQTTFDLCGNSYYFNLSVLRFRFPDEPRPLDTITSPRNKVWLEICEVFNTPGHGGKGYVFRKTPVMVLFVDGHVAGPFVDGEDFELYLPNTDKPAIYDPNGTSDQYD